MATSIIILSILAIINLGILYQFKFILAYILTREIHFSKLSKRDLFSPDVMEVYLLAVEHPEYFFYDGYCLEIQGKIFEIWATNTIRSRRFYTTMDEYKDLVEEMNSKLTHYDRYLLDKLCIAVREGQTKNLELFFDIKN